MGFVGEICFAEPCWIEALWQQGGIPVLASMALGADGEYYNVNADEMAAACAAACHANALIFLTDVPGVKDAQGVVIPWLSTKQAQDLAAGSVVSGGMNAWAAATYLVKRGVPSRLAHERIGKAVQICLERNCELQDLPLEDLQSLSPVFAEDFKESLTLPAVLAAHDVGGGTAPGRVRQAIGAARKKIESLREEVHAHA